MLIIAGLPFCLFVLAFNGYTRKADATKFVYAILLALGWINAVLNTWVWSLGKMLRARIRPELQRKTGIFTAAIVYNYCALIIFLMIAASLLISEIPGTDSTYDQILPSDYFGIVVPLWVISSIYAVRCAARTLVEAEWQISVKWIDYDETAWEIGFFPWRTQRRVNAIWLGAHEDEVI